jgi:Xaa-Pro aminopeptidase
MCIALEPKFVIPGSGAVGVEDTFLVTPNGMQCITPCDPAIIEL